MMHTPSEREGEILGTFTGHGPTRCSGTEDKKNSASGKNVFPNHRSRTPARYDRISSLWLINMFSEGRGLLTLTLNSK